MTGVIAAQGAMSHGEMIAAVTIDAMTEAATEVATEVATEATGVGMAAAGPMIGIGDIEAIKEKSFFLPVVSLC